MLAALGVALVASAGYVMSTEAAFAVDPADVTVIGASYADTAAIREDLQLAPVGDDTALDRNVFQLTTDEMERRIETLPSVLSASVQASLPNRLVVRIHERQPILVWHTANASWLVDVSGFVIAPADPELHPDVAGLPVVDDLRTQQQPLSPGASLPALDLRTARLLGAVTPADLGSRASALSLSVDDEDGWVMANPDGWRAIFGHFTSELHTTDDIPRQVQCLASLLTDREAKVETITLAVAPDRCGTFTDAGSAAQPGGNPGTSAEPGKGATPQPDPTRTPKPGKIATPKPGKLATPQPVPTRTPKPGKVATPKPGKAGPRDPGPTPTQKPPR